MKQNLWKIAYWLWFWLPIVAVFGVLLVVCPPELRPVILYSFGGPVAFGVVLVGWLEGVRYLEGKKGGRR